MSRFVGTPNIRKCKHTLEIPVTREEVAEIDRLVKHFQALGHTHATRSFIIKFAVGELTKTLETIEAKQVSHV
jgi:hypothetical protein